MEIKFINENEEELTTKELILVIATELIFFGFIGFLLYLLFSIF